jgi:HlyD family secretion protein
LKLSLRSLLYGIPAALIAALLWYAFARAAAEVDVATVTRGLLAVTVNEDGKTRIKERYVVSTPLAGELLRVDLHAGDPVQAGETLLAVIEPGDPGLLDVRAKAEAEARVKAAEARQQHAQTQLDRARATNAYAQKEHDRA